jgi:RND family efflux transporter MFP subunit
METKNADLSTLRIDRTNKDNDRPGKVKMVVWIAVIVILSLGGYFLANRFLKPLVEVKLTTVVLQSPSRTNAILTASGYIVAQRKAAVASKGTGRLVYIGVVEGDVVKENQIIARLEDNDIKAQLEQRKANLKFYEADLNVASNNLSREKELLEKGLSSQAVFDGVEAQYNRLLASIELAKAQILSSEVDLENTLIRAPFDGTVLTKNAEIGEIVAPFGASTNSKSAVVTIADMNSLLVETDVSESNIEKIIPGQDCEIILDAYPEKGYPGFVFKIVPTADRSKATVLVKVGFKNYDSRVLPEMSAKVSFLSNREKETQTDIEPALLIPLSSIVTRENELIAFKVEEDRVISVKIKTGRKFAGFIEVTSGLQNGDKVVEKPGANITDGIKIIVIQ